MVKKIVAFVVVILVLILLGSSFYIVNEDEVAVVKSLSKVVATVVDGADAEIVAMNLKGTAEEDIKIISEKGLHLKIPFIQSVVKYSSKYLTYMSTSEKINTHDDRYINIQMYGQYRIVDPVTFMLAVGTKEQGNRRMDESVYSIVITAANNLNFSEFFNQNTLDTLLKSKQDILNNTLKGELGIYISDIGINRKTFPTENIASIEEKMTMEIQKDSEKLIAQGDSDYIKAQAIADREKAEKIADATVLAADIKAKADAEAIRIYQDAIGQDLEFYQFITRMEIYKNMTGTTMFIDKDSDIFNLLNGYE